MGSVTCVCCGGELVPARDADARLGDMWCEECEWLEMRELLAENMDPALCPTHRGFAPPSRVRT